METIGNNMELVKQRVIKVVQLKTESKDKKKKVRDFKMPELDSNINAVSRKNFAPQSKRKISWA